MSLRRSAIGRCFLSLLSAIGWLCLLLDLELARPWLSRAVAPLCFLPSVGVAGYLAQHLDVAKKAALFIAAPTLAAMGMITGFCFFIFSAPGKIHLADSVSAALALAALGVVTAVFYLGALWRATLAAGNPRLE